MRTLYKRLILFGFMISLILLSACGKQKTKLDLDLEYTHDNEDFAEEEL